MARLGKRVSKMTAMVSRLPEPLIYDYAPVDLRRNGAPLGRRMPAPAPPVTDVPRVLAVVAVNPCWVGYCNKGCGRRLVSAVDPRHVRADRYACGVCQ